MQPEGKTKKKGIKRDGEEAALKTDAPGANERASGEPIHGRRVPAAKRSGQRRQVDRSRNHALTDHYLPFIHNERREGPKRMKDGGGKRGECT